MKAESIEQIREHLARGGRVLDAWGDEIDGLGRVCVYLKNKSAIYRISDLTSEAIAKWELLPLEEKPLPGVPASTLPLVTEDPTGQSCDDCEHCHGKGGRWDDESIDQWYWCEHCDAAKEHYAPILEKKKRKEKRHHELRAKVLFGQPWSIEEQLEVWELLTGEKIEHGKRCEACDGSGLAQTGPVCACNGCIGSGYTVRPTWMGERV